MVQDGPKGALRGVKVVEFGEYVPGPLLGMLLSDQGAEVVKVERPGGDRARAHPAFATWNRGKRSVVLDLKSPACRNDAQKLVRAADVVIENFRPGVAERLGIGYEELTSSNPGLVYCSLPGFGEGSPYRDRPGWDPVIGALTGLHQATSMTTPIEGSAGPLFTPLPAPSTFAAVTGAVSVAMALVARRRSGAGQRIEVPLHSVMFNAVGSRFVKFHDYEPENPFPFSGYVMARLFRCADGRWVQSSGVYRSFAGSFAKGIGREEWADELTALFEQQPADAETRDLWLGRFRDIYAQRTAQEWETAISNEGGCITVCRTIDEWMETDQATTARIVETVDDASFGRMRQPGVHVRLRGTAGAIQGRAPTLGEHTDEVLNNAVLNDPGPPRSASESPKAALASALQGVRVLDLTIILAGPICGRTLAEFGADVIKIDDPHRPADMRGWMEVNRGKRNILLDLKRPEGLEVFWRLLDETDVVVENNRKGALARLGIGYDNARRRKPTIIYASLNTYGHDGPWAERPGWEQLAQAASGIQVRRGGRDGTPALLTYPMNDCGTGLLGAFAVALALHERDRTGKGQQVDTGLALTASLLQSPFFLDYEGFERRDPEGIGVRGYSALSRLYPASDGWLYVHCPSDAEWQRFLAVAELESTDRDPPLATAQARAAHIEGIAGELLKVFPNKTSQTWLELLEQAGVSAAPNLASEDLRDDPYIRDAGLIVSRDHPGFGMVEHSGNVAQLSRTPVQLGRPAPALGADTQQVLTEAGYSPADVTALKKAGVVG